MELQTFTPQYLPAAAELFVRNFRTLRASVAALPATLEDTALISHKLERLLARHPGVVVLEHGRLVGYLVYMILDNFRDTGRRAAYCPEWAHAVQAGVQAKVYPQMYRQVGEQWAAQGCQVHAITLLANDPQALQTWFWSGFGLAVVDAVRPLQPLERPANSALRIRQAVMADADALASLEVEHRRYYSASPVFMAPRAGMSADDFRQFLAQPDNSVWLALDGSRPVGFLRLDGYELDGADAIVFPGTVFISGAFILPDYRGQGGSTAMLEAALRHHAALGKTCCAVDFETFNPDAAAFWPQHFQSVCLSLMRVPETVSLDIPAGK